MLPECVSGTGLYYGQAVQYPEIRQKYWIAKEGTKGEGGEKVTDPQIRLQAGQDWVEHNLRNSALPKSLAEQIKNKKNTPGTTIQICYAVPQNSAASINIIPMIFAETLKAKLEKETKGLGIEFETKPLYKLNKVSRDGFRPFEYLVARSVFDASHISDKAKKAIIVDDDNLSAMTLCEMGSSVVNKRCEVIALATCLSLKGGLRVRIHDATLAALEEALRANAGTVDDPVKKFSEEIKKYGFADGLKSLSNIEGLMLVAALYSPEKGSQIMPQLWEKATGVTWNDAATTYSAGHGEFPIQNIMNQPSIAVDQAIALMDRKYREYGGRQQSPSLPMSL